ncbi:MAG: hypothetical protein AAGF73_01835 [Actinomycetota bacterium]
MGSLLIVSGPPGAGKSSVAAELAALDSRSALVEGDRFFGFLAKGAIDPWHPESHEQNMVVTDAAAAATGRFAAEYTTVYDGVVGPWFLPAFGRATGLHELDYAVLLPPEEECVRRVKTRRGHGFTDEAAARSMWAQFNNAAVEQRHLFESGDSTINDIVGSIRGAQSDGRLRYLVHGPDD